MSEVKEELTAKAATYAGMKPREVVDAMNAPRKTGTVTQYRAVTAEEVYDAIGAASKAKLAAAGEAYSDATTDAQRNAAATGVAVYERLGIVGSVEIAPGTPGRAELDAAVSAGYLTAAERDALAALGTETVPVLQTLWQVWGWDSSVTIAQVEEAQS